MIHVLTFMITMTVLLAMTFFIHAVFPSAFYIMISIFFAILSGRMHSAHFLWASIYIMFFALLYPVPFGWFILFFFVTGALYILFEKNILHEHQPFWNTFVHGLFIVVIIILYDIVFHTPHTITALSLREFPLIFLLSMATFFLAQKLLQIIIFFEYTSKNASKQKHL